MQTNISQAIEFYLNNKGSYLFAQIESAALKLDELLKSHFTSDKIAQTGSIRRQMETIDLLEWCTTASADSVKNFFAGKDIDLVQEAEDHLLFKGTENIEIKFHLTSPESFYHKLFTTSCSVTFLDAWEKNFPVKEISYSNEEGIFSAAGISFIPPCLREEEWIIEKAKEKTIPSLIQPGDIKGLIHSHSNWSDGVNTIEEMAKEAIYRGLEYLVISDHSKSAFYANGLTQERIVAQHQYIDELNEKLSPFRIFKSIECDILNDGSMDYADDVLSTFDLVIASVHSNLKMTEEKAMTRLLRAIENRYVMILGHMTGRLLLSRNGYPIDHKKIIDACAANHVVIELNANPRRLDMDWRWIHYALEKNVLISINPDAHDIEGFDDNRYGVLAAQKAGLSKEKNLSSFTLAAFEQYLQDIRQLKGIN